MGGWRCVKGISWPPPPLSQDLEAVYPYDVNNVMSSYREGKKKHPGSPLPNNVWISEWAEGTHCSDSAAP